MAEIPPSTPPETPAAPPLRRRRRRGAGAVWLVLSLIVLLVIGGLGGWALSGRPLVLPVWAVAEVEARINRVLGLPGQAVSLGGIEIALDQGGAPALRLQDLRLVRNDRGATLAALPEVRLRFDGLSVLRGQILPRRLQVSGAQLRLNRDREGRLDLDFGGAGAGMQVTGLAGLFDAFEAIIAQPVFARLERVEADALSLVLSDAAAGRVWTFGDGRLTMENRDAELAGEISLSLQVPGGMPARATLSGASEKGTGAARLRATVEGVEARDLALAAPPLALLGALQAPISGKLSAELDADGRLSALSGALDLGAGALQPDPAAQPVKFAAAGLSFAFDPVAERLVLDRIGVESRTLRLAARGHVDMPGLAAGLPGDLITQIAVEDLRVDPEGLFAEAVTFSEGALDLRLRLDPFAIDIGQAVLVDGERRIAASGRVRAGADGWRLALDIGLNRITHERLLALWPVSLVPKTREWLAENVLDGTLSDVTAAVRLAPGDAPVFSLGYAFSGTDVRFLKTLPPIEKGYGHATIEGNAYVMVLDRGQVTPPEGGPIEMAGSVFSVLDILAKPAQAEVSLRTTSSLTAALSLLDQEPFRFLTKAGRGVDLGQGTARLSTVLRLPLVPKVPVESISYQVAGEVSGFSSDRIVPGRTITAELLSITADPKALEVAGAARMGAVAFDGSWRLGLRKEDKGASVVAGQVAITPDAVADFAPGLKGMLAGKGRGRLQIALEKDATPRLTLDTDLGGLRLMIPQLGHDSKAKGALRLEVLLGKRPEVTAISLDQAGLKARGRVKLAAGGGLAEATFDRVQAHSQAGQWLDARVVLTGRGDKASPVVALTGGSLDLRRMPDGLGGGDSNAGGGGPITVNLDKLRVSETIALTGLRGDFSTRGGFNGKFTARVNGAGAVTGTVVPSGKGSAVRLRSEDAGAVLAGAGIFQHARGGWMELQLLPEGARGRYRGEVTGGNFRVVNAPVLAEILSAISVVGLLEQLNGSGLVFGNAEARLILTAAGVEVRRASAVGVSMGVTMAGTWNAATEQLDMQGVISPIYLLNGVGAVLTRRGEGLFGFNYRLTGRADAPKINVNPLSILTPGMFRELFRRPVPRLEGQP